MQEKEVIMDSFKFSCIEFNAKFVDGKLVANVFTLESEDPEFNTADVNRIEYRDGNWHDAKPSEVEVNKLTEHAPGGWSRDAGYEIRYR